MSTTISDDDGGDNWDDFSSTIAQPTVPPTATTTVTTAALTSQSQPPQPADIMSAEDEEEFAAFVSQMDSTSLDVEAAAIGHTQENGEKQQYVLADSVANSELLPIATTADPLASIVTPSQPPPSSTSHESIVDGDDEFGAFESPDEPKQSESAVLDDPVESTVAVAVASTTSPSASLSDSSPTAIVSPPLADDLSASASASASSTFFDPFASDENEELEAFRAAEAAVAAATSATSPRKGQQEEEEEEIESSIDPDATSHVTQIVETPIAPEIIEDPVKSSTPVDDALAVEDDEFGEMGGSTVAAPPSNLTDDMPLPSLDSSSAQSPHSSPLVDPSPELHMTGESDSNGAVTSPDDDADDVDEQIELTDQDVDFSDFAVANESSDFILNTAAPATIEPVVPLNDAPSELIDQIESSSSPSPAATASLTEPEAEASAASANEPTAVTDDAEDDFGDFSSQPVVMNGVQSSAPIATAIIAPLAADQEEEEEDFADFSSGASASAPNITVPSTLAPAPTVAAVDEDGGDVEDEWGSFDSSSTSSAAVAPVVQPASLPVAPPPSSAADLTGSGAVADAITMWKLSPLELRSQLESRLAAIFPSPLPSSGSESFPPSTDTLEDAVPRLPPHSAAAPFISFKHTTIYTHLFDALGVAPPSHQAPTSPQPAADTQGGGEDGEILTTHMPAPTPSPQHAVGGEEEEKDSSSTSSSSEAPDTVPSGGHVQHQSGNWPSTSAVVESASFALDLDFFAQGNAQTNNSNNLQARSQQSQLQHLQHQQNSSNQMSTTAPMEENSSHNRSSRPPHSPHTISSSHATANKNKSDKSSVNETVKDDEFDWFQTSSTSGTNGTSQQKSNTKSESTNEEDEEDDDEEEEEEFADFSSAPPATTSTVVAPAKATTTLPVDAFIVSAAKPTRGELSLKRLRELVAGLPDLAFLQAT